MQSLRYLSDVVALPARSRAERFLPNADHEIQVFQLDPAPRALGSIAQISRSGLLVLLADGTGGLTPGQRLGELALRDEGLQLLCGSARVIRSCDVVEGGTPRHAVALAFDDEQAELIEALGERLKTAEWVSNELRAETGRELLPTNAAEHAIDKFYDHPSRDVLSKCDAFRSWIDDMQARGFYQRFFRVTVTAESNNRIYVFDPLLRRERPMLCFDSNSYLGLHRHPRVIARVESVLRQVGYGSPSAQLLGGTNRYLRELEVELSALHGREDTIVFPTGFAANAGVISALVRKGDALLRDRFAHASIQDACRNAPARYNKVFRHNDVGSLEEHLQRAEAQGCDGKLIVTDGTFSMHGALAPLPELVDLARRYEARLMVDDAHGIGVLGDAGRGIEEHFGMPGSVDILMGTLSKTLGAVGGYISGSRNLLYYLRFFAASGMFTTSLPAALCAGVVEALRVIREEPEHRERLWRNIRQFVPALSSAGFIVPEPASAIVTVFFGSHALMYEFNRQLFDAGIKCSSVAYPAVPKGEAILRLTMNSGHTPEDLEQAADILIKLGRKFDVLHRTPEQLRELGTKLAEPAAHSYLAAS